MEGICNILPYPAKPFHAPRHSAQHARKLGVTRLSKRYHRHGEDGNVEVWVQRGKEPSAEGPPAGYMILPFGEVPHWIDAEAEAGSKVGNQAAAAAGGEEGK